MNKSPVWGADAPPQPEEGKSKAEIFREPSYVETVDNHIYFYSDVGKHEVLQLNRRIRELNTSLFTNAQMQGREPASIFLHINSYGGSIFDGLAAMDTVLSCNVPVITVIDGCCASAATFISVVGKKRLIPKHGFMLIHQLSAFTWGKFRELQDDNINFIKLMETIRGIYGEYTKVPMKKIDEILDHDLWFDSDKCLEYGLVDEII
jgi:ATP-dependent protease ClpP protease subunit